MGTESGTLTAQTAFGSITARGSMVFAVLAGLVFLGFLYVEMNKRSSEHSGMEIRQAKQLDEMEKNIMNQLQYNECLNRLALYQQVLALKGEFVDFRNVPNDLVRCLPAWIGDGRKK